MEHSKVDSPDETYVDDSLVRDDDEDDDFILPSQPERQDTSLGPFMSSMDFRADSLRTDLSQAPSKRSVDETLQESAINETVQDYCKPTQEISFTRVSNSEELCKQGTQFYNQSADETLLWPTPGVRPQAAVPETPVNITLGSIPETPHLSRLERSTDRLTGTFGVTSSGTVSQRADTQPAHNDSVVMVDSGGESPDKLPVAKLKWDDVIDINDSDVSLDELGIPPSLPGKDMKDLVAGLLGDDSRSSQDSTTSVGKLLNLMSSPLARKLYAAPSKKISEIVGGEALKNSEDCNSRIGKNSPEKKFHLRPAPDKKSTDSSRNSCNEASIIEIGTNDGSEDQDNIGEQKQTDKGCNLLNNDFKSPQFGTPQGHSLTFNVGRPEHDTSNQLSELNKVKELLVVSKENLISTSSFNDGSSESALFRKKPEIKVDGNYVEQTSEIEHHFLPVNSDMKEQEVHFNTQPACNEVKTGRMEDAVDNGDHGSVLQERTLSLENFHTAPDVTPETEAETTEAVPSPEKDNENSPKAQDIVVSNHTFLLEISCTYEYCKASKTILNKEIVKVQERPLAANQGVLEHWSESTDKSKRESLSSAGSVYSDKTGLPYTLKPRVSLASVQTSSTSTLEDIPPMNFGPGPSLSIVEPWKHDCLIPLACDDALARHLATLNSLSSTTSREATKVKKTPLSRLSLASKNLFDKVKEESFDEPSKHEPLEVRESLKDVTAAEENKKSEIKKSTPKRTRRLGLGKVKEELSKFSETQAIVDKSNKGKIQMTSMAGQGKVPDIFTKDVIVRESKEEKKLNENDKSTPKRTRIAARDKVKEETIHFLVEVEKATEENKGGSAKTSLKTGDTLTLEKVEVIPSISFGVDKTEKEKKINVEEDMKSPPKKGRYPARGKVKEQSSNSAPIKATKENSRNNEVYNSKSTRRVARGKNNKKELSQLSLSTTPVQASTPVTRLPEEKDLTPKRIGRKIATRSQKVVSEQLLFLTSSDGTSAGSASKRRGRINSIDTSILSTSDTPSDQSKGEVVGITPSMEVQGAVPPLSSNSTETEEAALTLLNLSTSNQTKRRVGKTCVPVEEITTSVESNTGENKSTVQYDACTPVSIKIKSSGPDKRVRGTPSKLAQKEAKSSATTDTEQVASTSLLESLSALGSSGTTLKRHGRQKVKEKSLKVAKPFTETEEITSTPLQRTLTTSSSNRCGTPSVRSGKNKNRKVLSDVTETSTDPETALTPQQNYFTTLPGNSTPLNRPERRRARATPRGTQKTTPSSTATDVEQDASTPLFSPGLNVFACWKDCFYYPAALEDSDDSKSVRFLLDGTRMPLDDNSFLALSAVREGHVVQVADGQGYSFGLVKAVRPNSKYLIEVNRKDKNVKLADIRLTTDQAKVIKEEYSTFLSTPSTSSQKSAKDLYSPGRKRRREALVESTGSATSDEGHGSKKKAKQPPTFTQDSRNFEFTPGLEIDETVINVTQTTSGLGKKVPKSKRNILKEAEEPVAAAKLGPIPDEKSKIFAGLYFLLCNVKTKGLRITKKSTKEASSNSDFSMSESEDANFYQDDDRFPFDETHLRRQLEAGGGTVCERFSDLPVAKHRSTRLVTNRPNRSAKFLLCLAHDIQIVLHVQVIEACRRGVSQSMKLHHIGWSNVDNKWLDCPARMYNTFRGKTIHIYSKSCDTEADALFIAFWTVILQKSGASVTKDMNFADVVVTDHSLPKEVIDVVQAIGSAAPTLVSTNWVIESLMHGYPLDSKAHPSFHYHYEPSS